MKRIATIVTVILIALLISGCTANNATMNRVSAETAKTIALKSVGLTALDVTFEDVDLEEKNGLEYYGITFSSGGERYAYDIDALTGVIIDYRIPESVEISKDFMHENQTAGAAQGDLIGEDKAKEMALAHAGLSASDVTFVKSGLDREDGKRVYDVEFYTATGEFDYDVDAESGAIVSFDFDAEYYDRTSGTTDKTTGNATDKMTDDATANTTNITADRAKEIALAHAGLTASQVTFVEVETDRDDGKLVYDIEFYNASKEYDYEIDAASGEILSYDYDSERYIRPTIVDKTTTDTTTDKSTGGATENTTTGTVTAAQAKKIALAQVPGSTESDIREFEVDYDDGRLAYEGKIYYGKREYEFEIDGYSGAIREWEVESIYD